MDSTGAVETRHVEINYLTIGLEWRTNGDDVNPFFQPDEQLLRNESFTLLSYFVFKHTF